MNLDSTTKSNSIILQLAPMHNESPERSSSPIEQIPGDQGVMQQETPQMQEAKKQLEQVRE